MKNLLEKIRAAYKDLNKEMQGYMSYIVNELLMEKTGIFSKTAIDKNDDVYKQWTTEESISLQEYRTYEGKSELD